MCGCNKKSARSTSVRSSSAPRMGTGAMSGRTIAQTQQNRSAQTIVSATRQPAAPRTKV